MRHLPTRKCCRADMHILVHYKHFSTFSLARVHSSFFFLLSSSNHCGNECAKVWKNKIIFEMRHSTSLANIWCKLLLFITCEWQFCFSSDTLTLSKQNDKAFSSEATAFTPIYLSKMIVENYYYLNDRKRLRHNRALLYRIAQTFEQYCIQFQYLHYVKA